MHLRIQKNWNQCPVGQDNNIEGVAYNDLICHVKIKIVVCFLCSQQVDQVSVCQLKNSLNLWARVSLSFWSSPLCDDYQLRSFCSNRYSFNIPSFVKFVCCVYTFAQAISHQESGVAIAEKKTDNTQTYLHASLQSLLSQSQISTITETVATKQRQEI